MLFPYFTRRLLQMFGGLAAMIFGTIATHADVLFHDDFEGTSLDGTQWTVADWKLGRARLGNTPKVVNGMARLKVQTFDPKHPGQDFVGTEIDTVQTFPIGSGLEFEARVRFSKLPAGLVPSLFTYTSWTSSSDVLSDEIDYEFLTKQIRKAPKGQKPAQVTTWHDFDNTHPSYDSTHENSQNVPVAGLDYSQFNTFTIRWLPNEVDWYVNGTLIHTATTAVPQQAMNLCLNFWVPGKGWGEAFSPYLLPTKTAAGNQVYFYDVDYVEVRTVASGS